MVNNLKLFADARKKFQSDFLKTTVRVFLNALRDLLL